MSYESGDFSEWQTTQSDVYVRSYIELREKRHCAQCGKALKKGIWHHEINGEIFCSEECSEKRYPQLLGLFHKRRKEVKAE